MMAVNSYPELFTTLIGWREYQNLWSIVTGTGLAYVPFLVMIIQNTAGPFLSQQAKSAEVIALRRIELDLVSMFLVIMLACQPVMTIAPSVLHFKPVCDPNIDATPGHSGTTYDTAFSNIGPVKVPFWWDAVMGLSSGFVAAAETGLGCVPNLREDQVKLQLTQIKSAPLRKETQAFIHNCWIPAWRKYNEDQPNISQYTKQYGNTDPEWPGSHAFLNMPGYYDSLSAPGPIIGFPYNPTQNFDQGKNDEQWGTPTCKAWWQTPTIGLHDQLLAQINPNFLQKLKAWINQDHILQTVIENNINGGYVENSGLADKFGGGFATGTIASIGLAWHSIKFFPEMYVLIESLPLIQAYLLMACFVFLALALPMARYRVSAVIAATFVIFSIIFWSYLWQLAQYVDTAMIHALYPPATSTTNTSKSYGGTQILTDMVALIMYVALPLFWTTFMGYVGVQVGSGATGMIDRAGGVASGAGGMADTIGAGVIKNSHLKGVKKKVWTPRVSVSYRRTLRKR